MNKYRLRTTLPIAVVALSALAAVGLLSKGWPVAKAQDDHSGHDHADHAAPAPTDHDDHDGHAAPAPAPLGNDDHDDHDDHDGHADGAAEFIALTPAQRAEFGIQVASATRGNLTLLRRFPGETRLDEDHMAHIVPRAPGIVRAVNKSVGAEVREGEVLAWLESADLGAAKVDYLSQWTELSCYKIDLTRAEEVHTNTKAFLDLLAKAPSLQALRQTNGRVMGEYRSKLVSAYAEFVFAKETHAREKSLYEKEIGSGEDLLAAERALKKAEAEYTAAVDATAFSIEHELLEARSSNQIQSIALLGAERRLHVFGLDEAQITALPNLATTLITAAQEVTLCTGPNCTDCEDDHQPDAFPSTSAERLGWYALTAPFDGIIIDRHLTLGENIAQDANAFTIANLDSIWVDIQIYQRDLAGVTPGQELRIFSQGTPLQATGVIQFISPMVDKETRTALARVVLPNPDNAWRSGLFVEAEAALGSAGSSVVVPADAVQKLGQEDVVFIEAEGGFAAAPVTLGRQEGKRVEILAGLSAEQRYVIEGAFALKAQITTSGLGGHAGHGH